MKKNMDTSPVTAHLSVNLTMRVLGDLKLHLPNDLLWTGKPHQLQVPPTERDETTTLPFQLYSFQHFQVEELASW